MKRLLSFVCVAMLTIAASAQITWNVKAGGGIATLWGSDADNSKPHFVAKAGLGVEKPLSPNFSLMPSLEIAWKGFKYEEKGYDYGYGMSSLDLDFIIDMLYIQVPVLAAYRISPSNDWNITVKGGPYVAYSIYDHYKVSNELGSASGSNELDVNKFDAGINAGIDFEYHRFVFGVEAEIGFFSLAKNDSKINNLAFYATIGYKF